MSLDRLHTFLQVYRQRSMGRAAATLSLTQPAVSNQIAALERELGYPLFSRSPAGVSPTTAADGLARDVAGAIDALDAAMSARLARSETLTGLIHVGAPPELFSALGPRILSAFAGTAIRLEVHLGGGGVLRDLLENGTLDLALMASRPPERRCGFETIGSERLLLVAHPGLRDTMKGRTIDANALCTQPFVAYDAELSLIRQFFAAVFGETCDGVPKVLVPDLRSVIALVAAEPAWTVAPDYLAAPFVYGARLVELMPALPAPNPLYLVWPKLALRTPRVAFAKEAVIAAIKTGPA